MSFTTPLSASYRPTTAMLIDDNVSFLRGMQLILKQADVLNCAYHDPQAAALFLRDVCRPMTGLQASIEVIDADRIAENYTADGAAAIHVHYHRIINTIFNAQRFDEISVVVVDFGMPGMNGLELCKQLKDSPIKKIMLTGEADEQLAVQAFNAGLIDHFMLKNAPDCAEQLVEQVRRMQHQYFLERSRHIMHHAASQALHVQTALYDSVYIDFFNKHKAQKGWVEYYLFSHQGGYLGLNAEGHLSWLCVAFEDDMNGYYDMARDHGASDEVLGLLAERSHVPVLIQKHDLLNLKAEDWEHCLYPVQVLNAAQTLYIASVDAPFHLMVDDIVSCRQFIEDPNNSLTI